MQRSMEILDHCVANEWYITSVTRNVPSANQCWFENRKSLSSCEANKKKSGSVMRTNVLPLIVLLYVYVSILLYLEHEAYIHVVMRSARNGYPGTRITTRYPGTRRIPGYPGMSHYPIVL